MKITIDFSGNQAEAVAIRFADQTRSSLEQITKRLPELPHKTVLPSEVRAAGLKTPALPPGNFPK